MLKMIRIEKNTIVYKSIPFVIFYLKWLDTKILGLLKLLNLSLRRFVAWYSSNISEKIDKLYIKNAITKIKPKHHKAKKKAT